MKKIFYLVFTFISSLRITSAQDIFSPERIGEGSFGISHLLSALFGPFFAALLNAPRGLLFENILLFFIIFSVTFMSVRHIKILKDNTAIVLIVTISVSVLAGRFVSVEMIYTTLISYQVLGVSLTAFLPLLIGFFFIHSFDDAPILRKMFWIFFAVVFLAMWDARYHMAGAASWIYFWTAVASVIFFLLDGTIHRALNKAKLQSLGERTNDAASRKIRRELYDLNNDMNRGIITPEEYYKIKKRLTKQLHSLAKY